MNADTIWNNVKPLIKQQNTTQEAIAKKCDISFRTFQGWISKSITPDAISIFKIAQALNVSVEYLITGQSESKLGALSAKLDSLVVQIQDIQNELKAL